MKNHILSFVVCSILLCLSTTIEAQNETITLKDGTTFKGYIAKQDFITGKVEVAYNQLTAVISNDGVKNKTFIKKGVNQLSESWKIWAEENNKLIKDADSLVLNMVSMNVPVFGQHDYVILEHGTKTMRCFTIGEGVVEYNSSDIDCIQKPLRESTLLTDLDDIIQTDSQTYIGVILEQYPGNKVKLWNKQTQAIHVIEYREIRSIGKSRFNPEYSLYEQSPYVETLILNNGESGPGVIVENGFYGDVNLVLATKENDAEVTRQYSYKDVKGIKKSINPNYSPRYDIILSEEKSVINRTAPIDFATINEYHFVGPFQVYYLDSQRDSSIVEVLGKEVSIETSISDITDVYVFNAVKRNAKLVDNKESVELYTYTYSDVLLSSIEVAKSISINGTTKLEFVLPDYGEYFVYLRKLNKCWFFRSVNPNEQLETPVAQK